MNSSIAWRAESGDREAMRLNNPTTRFVRPSGIGFTLVELLVVIVIIGALAVLGFSTITKMRARANDVLALGNMRQIGIGIAGYMSDKGHLPRFAGTGVSPAISTKNTMTQAYVLGPYLGQPEPTSTIQYSELFKPPGLKSDNMGGRSNWYEVTCYAMYSTNDLHKSKAYFPKGTLSDSTGADVGPFGRTGTGGNPTSEGWVSGVMDRALAKYSEDNQGKNADISMVPAMYEINAKYPKVGGGWPWPVPQLPVRGDHVNVLYFDWHAAAVKPDYLYKP